MIEIFKGGNYYRTFHNTKYQPYDGKKEKKKLCKIYLSLHIENTTTAVKYTYYDLCQKLLYFIKTETMYYIFFF